MKRIDRFLIGILWVNAVIIAALWFFDRFFSFNLMSGMHWRYLAELQVLGNVDVRLYASFVLFVVISLVGLYFLIVPWHRKIVMVQSALYQSSALQPTTDQTLDIGIEEKEEFFIPVRPPRLNLSNVFIPTKQEARDINNATPILVTSSEFRIKIRDLLTRIGFIAKDMHEIEGIKFDFCVIGTDDILMIGLLSSEQGEITASEQGESMWNVDGRSFKSPVAQILMVVQKLQDLFDDVLDDGFQVNIIPFVFVEGTIINLSEIQSVWNTLGINVFFDMESLEEFLNKNKPRELDEDEKSEFNAYSEFIDTVADHFSGVGTQ